MLGFGCSKSDSSDVPLKPGSLYSVDDGEGAFKIAKVLVVEDQGVHIRLYKNTYSTRPDKIDPSTLSLGSFLDKDGFGIGHLPLSLKGFRVWKPALLMEGKVAPDELEGYNTWKEGGGGVFK